MAVLFGSSLFRRPEGGAPENQALKRARLYLNNQKAANDAGVINNPTAYDQAIKILEPFANDLDVANQIASYQADKNQLAAKLNDESFKLNNMKTTLEETMFNIGKNNYKDAGSVVLKVAAAYDEYYSELTGEITNRLANGQSYTSMLTVKKDVEEKLRGLGELSRSFLAGRTQQEDEQNPTTPRTSFGFFVKTNPSTGRIINFSLQPADTLDPNAQKGYFKTDSFYGGVPIYVNAVRTPTNNELIGRLGNSTFKVEVDEEEVPDQTGTLKVKTLKLQNPKDFDLGFKESVANVFRAGKKQKEFDISKGAYDVDLSQTDFETALNIPRNSIAKDRLGNFYYLNQDGKLYQATNAKTIGETLGISEQEVNEQAYYLTQKDLETITVTQDPSENRVIPSSSSPGQQQSTVPAPIAQVGTLPQQTAPTELPPSSDTSILGGFARQRAERKFAEGGIEERNRIAQQEKTREDITSGQAAKLGKIGQVFKKAVGGATKFLTGR